MIQFLIPPSSLAQPSFGATPNFATEKEPKRNFLYFADVTLVEVDIKSERFIKSTCLIISLMFDTKSSESETFIDGSIEGITNLMMEFHHFQNEYDGILSSLSNGGDFMMSDHHKMRVLSIVRQEVYDWCPSYDASPSFLCWWGKLQSKP